MLIKMEPSNQETINLFWRFHKSKFRLHLSSKLLPRVVETNSTRHMVDPDVNFFKPNPFIVVEICCFHRRLLWSPNFKTMGWVVGLTMVVETVLNCCYRILK